MINLLQSNIDIKAAKDEHWAFFSCYVQIKLKGKNYIPNSLKRYQNLPQKKYKPKSTYFTIIEDLILNKGNLETIILGHPKALLKLHKKLVRKINQTIGHGTFQEYLNLKTKNMRKNHVVHDLYLDLKSLFNYEDFASFDPTEENYSAYKLADNLNVRSCAFCNRTYTLTRRTRSEKKLMRPQFDHWFPKTKYPLLAISFFNLVPCCTYCNSSVKGDTDLDPELHSHPYIIEHDGDNFEFNYDFDAGLNSYKISLIPNKNTSGKTAKTLEYLKIDQMYEGHQSELRDLIKLKQAYGINYIQKMGKLFPESNLHPEEVYRLLFGTEIDEKNYHKRPFSKFKRDILSELINDKD